MGIDPKNNTISQYLHVKRLEFLQENSTRSENYGVISDAASSCANNGQQITSSLPDLNSLP